MTHSKDKEPGALGDYIRAAVAIMQAQPGGLNTTHVKLEDGRWAQLRILPDKPPAKKRR